MAPTLYYSEHSAHSRSVLLVIKALGIDVNLKKVDLAKEEQLKPEYLKLNPQHSVPTLVEEDGFSIWDSHVINPYLASKYGKDDSLYPKDLKKRTVIDQRLHFNNGTLYARLHHPGKELLFGNSKEIPEEDVKTIKEVYGFLETFLEKGDFVAGNELSVADFSIATATITANVFVPILPNEFPRITAWIARMEALPYFKEVNDNGRKEFEAYFKSRLSLKS